MSHDVRVLTAESLPGEVADHVLGLLAAAQRERGSASLVLTGGSVSRFVHRALAQRSRGGSDVDCLVDWGRVEVWWGDERYVAADHPERNAGQAREDLLRHVPVDPSRVHEMAASDAGFDSADDAARHHAQELRRVLGVPPVLDVLMLGIGPDGHCASLFPGREEVGSDADVLAVHDSPKPPPTRISLGMRLLRSADHVVFVAVGEDKAPAVSRSVAGGDVSVTPAAGPRGRHGTTWYVDAAAAAQLP